MARKGKRRGRSSRELTPEEQLDSLGAYLRSPLTDWDSFYFRIRTSPIGADFPRERFLRTPISVLKWVMDKVVDKEQADANLTSLSTARMADLLLRVAHSFGGSKKPVRSMPKDWLPFPNYKPSAKEADQADEPTKFILTELVQRFEIPVYVFVALNGRADDTR